MINEEANNTEIPVEVKKKRGRKKKVVEEVNVNEAEPMDYDSVIKVLDSAKKKIERMKCDSGEKKDGKENKSILSFIIPLGFLLVILIRLFISVFSYR